jgi:hypothetical protein
MLLFRLVGGLFTMAVTWGFMMYLGVVSNPLPANLFGDGQLIEHTPAEVAAALEDMELPEDLPCEGILCSRVTKRLSMVKPTPESIAWTMYADQHPVATLTATLEPKKEGAATVLFTELAEHELPPGALDGKGLGYGAGTSDLFKLATAEALGKLDAQLAIAATQQRQEMMRSAGMKSAMQVAANPLAVQREAMAMQREFADMERDSAIDAAERRKKDWYAGRSSSSSFGSSSAGQPSFDAGKPMIDPTVR